MHHKTLKNWPDKTSIDPKILANLPSLRRIRQIIPDDLLRSSTACSSYYLLRSYAMWIILVAIMTLLSSSEYRSVIYPIYIIASGIVLWGIFVIGHDAGHGSFSRRPFINELVGQMTHSLTLIIPYRAWQISHRLHHKFNANLEKDQVKNFMPRDSIKARILAAYPMFTGIAYYLYLAGIFGPNHYRIGKKSPPDDIAAAVFYRELETHRISTILSLLVVVVSIALQLYAIKIFGILPVILYYYLPLLVATTLLVCITFLQHSDENLVWYADHNWNFVKGALMSVDRDYGLIHGLTNHVGTHQIHHLISSIPHYNLVEATYHFRLRYPELYLQRTDSVFMALIRNTFDLIKYSHWNSHESEVSIALRKSQPKKFLITKVLS